MSDNDKRVAFSFRARLVITMTVLLLCSFAMVQYLNQRSQHEVRDVLAQQKASVDNTFFQHVTDITKATSLALTNISKHEYLYDILKKPEYANAVNRERIRHIIIVDEHGKITDSSEEALKDLHVQVPDSKGASPFGQVVRGDPVAALLPDDEDESDVPDTYWTSVPTVAKGVVGYQTTWVAIVASNRQVTGTIDQSQTDVATAVESTALVQSRLTLGIFALAVALAVLLVWRFTRPIRTLSEAAERVAEGKLDFTVDIARRDEMGQLASTFNAMIGGLKAKLELEDRLNNAERAAVIGRLTSAIAHEIRNPLNFINLSIDHVRSKYPPPEPRDRERFDRLLGAIKEETGRLARLVNDVLNFGRPANLHVRTVDVREIVDAVLALVRTQAEEQGIVLETLAPDGPIEIEADPERLKSSFSNIVINAVHAMPDGGRLDVRIEPVGAELRISFADSGMGIPADALDRVFEPYYSTKDTGTGLGLAVTKKIVEEHGGRIRVESVPGEGTTFEVDLPREHAAAGAPRRLTLAETKP